MVQKQPKKQLYKIRTFASDQSGNNSAGEIKNPETEKAPTLKAEMSKTIDEISHLDTADLISSPTKTPSRTALKKVVKENIIDESVVTPVRSDLPVSKSKIDIAVSNEDSESATIITDTKKDRFKLFPAISASIKKWFGDYKKNKELKKVPKYTVPETARRKGIIQKATSQTGIGETADFDSIRERVKQRQKFEEKAREEAKISIKPNSNKGFTKKVSLENSEVELEKEKRKGLNEKEKEAEDKNKENLFSQATPAIPLPKAEVVIKYQNDKKTTKPNWEMAIVKDKEEKASTFWTPKVEPAFPLLEKELIKNFEKEKLEDKEEETTPLPKPTLGFSKAKAPVQTSNQVTEKPKEKNIAQTESERPNSKQISSPVIKINLASKPAHDLPKSISTEAVSPVPKTAFVPIAKAPVTAPLSFEKVVEKDEEIPLAKNEPERPLFASSSEQASFGKKSGFSDNDKKEIKTTFSDKTAASKEVRDIRVSGFSGFERGVRQKPERGLVGERNQIETEVKTQTQNEAVVSKSENLVQRREVALQTPKTKNSDYRNVVFKEGKIKRGSSLNLFSGLDTNSLALSIAVLIVVLSGAWFYISESNRKNAQVSTVEMLAINPHLLNGEFSLKNGEISSKEEFVNSIKQEFSTPKNSLSYFAFGTPDKLNYLKPSAILLLLDLDLEANFSQSVSSIFFGSLDKGQPFLILNLTSYNSALGGMLKWEENIYKDLTDIFSLNQEEVLGKFADANLSGEDIRILKNDVNAEKLVYSIVDKRFVIITTDTISLGEILADLNY